MSDDNLLSAQIHEKIFTYFDGDEAKTDEWMKTPNPLIGGITPLEMFINGRGKKLLKWIENSLDEDDLYGTIL